MTKRSQYLKSSMIVETSTAMTIKMFIVTILYIPMVTLLNYLDLDHEAIFILSALLVVDTVTGVMKVVAMKDKPTSTRLANGIISKGLLFLVPLIVALMAKGLDLDLVIFVKSVVSLLIISESYSVLGNIYTVIYKKKVEEFDVMSIILKKIRALLNKILGDE